MKKQTNPNNQSHPPFSREIVKSAEILAEAYRSCASDILKLHTLTVIAPPEAEQFITSIKSKFESIVYPAAMYGIQTIDHGVFSAQIDSHVKQIQGIFWKKWCGLSVYTRNTSLLHHILGDDFLRIDRASPLKRRIIAQYYANEAHHLICLVERCFESQLDCICRYCNNNIDFRHLDTCHGFTECSNTVEKLLKATRQA